MLLTIGQPFLEPGTVMSKKNNTMPQGRKRKQRRKKKVTESKNTPSEK